MKLKSQAEIRIIREGGHRLATILTRLKAETKPGISTGYLEELADKLISETGGVPAFKNYPLGGGLKFPSILCISINNEIVHGSSLPSREIRSGDIVDIDIGMEWPATKELQQEFRAPINKYSRTGGFFTDHCATVGAGKISADAKKLIRITRECLDLAIKQAKPGNTINDIGRAVQEHAEKHAYGVVRDLVGHGLGYFAHEKPDVFNYTIADNSPDNIRLKPGLVIAIEPMINLGTGEIKIAKNAYTILTADNAISAHFEHTIVITETACEILTKI